MTDALGLFLLVIELWVPLFWLLVHPFAGFWRRRPRRHLAGLALTVWMVGALALVLPSEWWLAERFLTAWWRIPIGLALGLGDVWLTTKVEREMGWRVMIGLPETVRSSSAGQGEDSTPATEGLYAWVRHPRYLGTLLAWAAAVALTGATRLGWLVLGFVGLMLLMIECEERELVARLGTSYRDYRRRVPRLLPRWPADS